MQNTTPKKIIIGCDHGGYQLKEDIKAFLLSEGYGVDDVGTYSTDSMDYPQSAKKIAEAVSVGTAERGIAICTTGIGMSIAVNRYKNVRGSLCFNEDMAKLTRDHNDSNVIVFGQKYTPFDEAKIILSTWLSTPFGEGERHKRRIGLIDKNQ